jgi:hypothetical protein
MKGWIKEWRMDVHEGILGEGRGEEREFGI